MLSKNGRKLDFMWLPALRRCTVPRILPTAGCPVLGERHALAAGGPGCHVEWGGRCRARSQRPCQRAGLHPAPLREHHAYHAGERSLASRVRAQLSCCLAWILCHSQITTGQVSSPGRRFCMSGCQLFGRLSQTATARCLTCSPSQHQAGAALHLVPRGEHHVCHLTDKSGVPRVAELGQTQKRCRICLFDLSLVHHIQKAERQLHTCTRIMAHGPSVGQAAQYGI